MEDDLAMTPDERERLTRQLTIITAPLPSAPRKALPEKAGESSEETTAPPKALQRRIRLGHLRRMRLVLFAAVLGLALIGTGLVEGLSPNVFGFGGQLFGLVPAPPPATAAPGEIGPDVIARNPTISVSEIARVLQRVNSPILPYAGDVYTDGIQYKIDPVFALAIWMKESREASDGSVAATYHNPGYTEGLGSDPRCSRWACWPTWPEGIAGWFHYMRVFFVDRGYISIYTILPIYAPPSENNTNGYLNFVMQQVANWRAESAAQG